MLKYTNTFSILDTRMNLFCWNHVLFFSIFSIFQDFTANNEKSNESQIRNIGLRRVAQHNFLKRNSRKTSSGFHFKISREQHNRKQRVDADKSFLLSLLSDLRKLNGDEKLDFRIHCLQFFRELRKNKQPNVSYSRRNGICDYPN